VIVDQHHLDTSTLYISIPGPHGQVTLHPMIRLHEQFWEQNPTRLAEVQSRANERHYFLGPAAAFFKITTARVEVVIRSDISMGSVSG
jgi:hypothetical protein